MKWLFLLFNSLSDRHTTWDSDTVSFLLSGVCLLRSQSHLSFSSFSVVSLSPCHARYHMPRVGEAHIIHKNVYVYFWVSDSWNETFLLSISWGFFKSHFVFFVHLNTKQKSVFTAAIKTEKFTPKPSGWINGAIGQRKTTSIFNDWIKSVFDIGEYFFKWVELIAVQIFYGRSNYSWRSEQEIKVISALLQITKKENK